MLVAPEMKIPGRRGPGDLAQFGDEVLRSYSEK